MSQDTPELDGRIEALLFSSEMPLPARRLADLTASPKGEVLAAIDRLNVFYGESGRAFRIAEIAGGYQMVTVPEHATVLAGLHKEKVPTRLSRAALETLAIIAFKQPVTRAEIDRIRGVSASDGVLRHLMERKAVRIAGRADAPGRPLLYGTTHEFLSYFGLAAVGDLPRTEELEAMLAGEPLVAAEEADLFGEPGEAAPDAPTEAAAVPSGTEAPSAEPTEPEASDAEAEFDDEADERGDEAAAADDDGGNNEAVAADDDDDEDDGENDEPVAADDDEDDEDADEPTDGDDGESEPREDQSHSGEESDDREGVVAT